jgi:hypothetical protein
LGEVEVASVRRGGRRIPLYAQDWVQSPPVVRWRGRIAAGTFPTFFSHLWRLLAQIGKNPEEAVEWAKAAEDPYEILDAIQGYVLGLDPELRYKTKFNAYEAARSFFQHNRIMLPVDRTFQIRTDTPPVSRRISIENVRELIGLASQPLRRTMRDSSTSTGTMQALLSMVSVTTRRSSNSTCRGENRSETSDHTTHSSERTPSRASKNTLTGANAGQRPGKQSG